MAGDYRKYSVEMYGQTARYRLWKRGREKAVCIFESYREKRSVSFSVMNLLPSPVLLREENREYHLLLLGSSDGEIIHRDFGAVLVNPRGEGALRRKFTGHPLSCYTHCLLAAVDRKTGSAETVLTGTMPFAFRETAEKPVCKKESRNRVRGEEEPRSKDEIRDEPRSKDEICGEDGAAPGFSEIWESLFGRFYKEPFSEVFTKGKDETGADWCRVESSVCTFVPAPLRTCEKQIEQYGHYMIGKKGNRFFAAIPGRFLQREQPRAGEERASLWQPLRGGEIFFEDPQELSGTLAEEIYGYWIWEIERETGELAEF